jgi:preprotein translocase subunit YajC
MSIETFSTIFFIGVIVFFIAAIIGVVIIIRKSLKMEKRAEKWRNEDIKVNDEVWMSRGKNYKELEASIVSINGDEVVIQATVNKSEIYPNEDTK